VPVPHGYSIRPARRGDLPAVLALVSAADSAQYGSPDVTEEDILDEWDRPGHDLERDSWLARDPGGGAAGYAWLWNRAGHHHLDGYGAVHPEHRGRGVGSALVRGMEARGWEHAALARPGIPVDLYNWIASVDTAASGLLLSRGYVVVRHMWRMVVELGSATPAASPASTSRGIRVRPFVEDRDLRLVHAALMESFRGQFGFVQRSFEEWEAHVVNRRDYDPGLWFVAEDQATGEVAGALLGSTFLDQGWVMTLGVRPSWRGLGAGRALLLRSFLAYRERGLEKAALAVDSQNESGALDLYESAGMRVERQHDQLRKRLRD
jgi:mycothiol synthase